MLSYFRLHKERGNVSNKYDGYYWTFTEIIIAAEVCESLEC